MEWTVEQIIAGLMVYYPKRGDNVSFIVVAEAGTDLFRFVNTRTWRVSHLSYTAEKVVYTLTRYGALEVKL